MPTSIRLSADIEQRLHCLAATGRSKAQYVRDFIARGLEDLEDYHLPPRLWNRSGAAKGPS